MSFFRKIPLIGYVLVSFLLLASTGAQNSETQIDSIISALDHKQFDKALELLHTAVQHFPSDPQLWAMQGVAYAGEGRNKEAVASFRRALTISPDYLPALHQEAQLMYEAGSMAAIPVLQHILKLQPGDPTTHAMIAVVEYKNGHCDAAIPHFAKSGTLLDSQIDGLHAYATCLVRAKQFEDAAKVFERALAINDDPQERRVLASVQLMEPNPQGALTTLTPLFDSGSEDASTLELAANAYEDSGDTEKAVATLRQAILLDPRNVNLYLDFAQLSAAHQSFQVGIDVVSDGIGQQPNSAQLYFARGVLFVQVADYNKAEVDLEKAYELDPNESLTAAAQGLLAVQQNDLDRALADVQQKLKRKPNDALLLYLQADVLAQKGADPGTPAFQLALQSAKRAVSLRPTLAAARAVLAKLYLQSGQNQEAANQCRKALEIDPKDQTSLYRLIQALRKTGKTEAVPDLLKQLAQLRQESAKVQKQRNRYKLVEGDTTQ
jgi:tetratricopeptide (TPR) repeat protein